MAFKESNDIEDFEGKIDWEGGVTGAMEYGLSSDDYDLPDDVAEKWEEMRDLYSDFETLEGEFWALMANHRKD